MWECVQQYLQDTRNRSNPHLKDVTTMTIHKRQQNRESFRQKMRPTTPDIDDEQWDPSHSVEDILLQRKSDNTPGEYLGPELFTTRKREQQVLSIDKTGPKARNNHILRKTITGEKVTSNTTPAEKVDTIHLLDMALKLRGMLLETTGLMSFQKHDEWRRRLLASMQQEPTYSNESAPGITHILKADREIWYILDEKCQSGT